MVSDETPSPTPRDSSPEWAGSTGACILLGLVFWAIAVHFLVLAPGAPASEDGAQVAAETVNLQRLFIGLGSALSGSVFVAAALRPRTRPTARSEATD